jgi:16S rRNA (adenine1518-N6/adenine1519-N6)-dimethyltransferase
VVSSRAGSTSTSSTSRAPRPKRRFGQHFLTDPHILERIVGLAEVGPADTVVEVGPGRGSLTDVLARRARRVVAVEVDRDLIEGLRDRFDATPNVSIVEGDVLSLPPDELLRRAGATPPYVVVANLPYNVASAVLRHFLESRIPPTRMTVMVQREVADAIVARPGAMSLLSVAVQMYGDARTVLKVPPGAFQPPPRVQSAVVRIDVLPRPRVDVPLDEFFMLVRAGFATPRKQLRNGLSIALHIAPVEAERVLRVAGVDPARRPQTLSIDEWAALTRAWRARDVA